ncbi:MAG: glycosyltransferase family 4 protein [Gammaproteobacteria bacterium]|nr:glycosyltransferase family 4 protein [Gammaproteobacteria bacterium]
MDINNQSRTFRFLYATREKYPTYRVDLTELFSAGLIKKGHAVDWHMQSAEASSFKLLQLNSRERLFLGGALKGKGIGGKLANRCLGLWHDIQLFSRARKKIYDFVQVRDNVLAGYIVGLALKGRGTPFYYWMSFPFPEADLFRAADKEIDLSRLKRAFYRMRGTLLHWLLYRHVLPHTDHIFVQSEQMAKQLAAKGISQERMTPVPMGINLDQVDNTQISRLGNTNWQAKTVLVYMGTMVRVRRIEFLIQMLHLVRKTIPEAILLLVGDAPESDMQRLRDEAQRLGLQEHVIFTGFVSMEEAWAYIKMATVCFSPFRPSPILDVASPTKVIEYMALRRPVVANKNPDQAKVLSESGAGRAVEYCPEAFASEVIHIVENTDELDGKLEAGYEYVRRYRSYAALSQQLEDKYRDLLWLDMR